MKLKTLLLSSIFLFSSAMTSIAQEKKVLSNIGNEDPNQASFKFEKETYDFGTIVQGESTTHEFTFTNTGSEPLIISKAEGSCGCTVPIWPKEPILKGQTAAIKVTFNSTGKFGVQDKTVTLTSNAAQEQLILHMKGNVEKPAEGTTTDKPKN